MGKNDSKNEAEFCEWSRFHKSFLTNVSRLTKTASVETGVRIPVGTPASTSEAGIF